MKYEDLSKKQNGVEHAKARDRVQAKQVWERKKRQEHRLAAAKYQRKIKR